MLALIDLGLASRVMRGSDEPIQLSEPLGEKAAKTLTMAELHERLPPVPGPSKSKRVKGGG